MKNKISPFTCPRCGYQSSKKWDMHRHLYKRTTRCCGEVEDIELTEEIKECIMNNKTYKLPKDTNEANTIIINNVIPYNDILEDLKLKEELKEYIRKNKMTQPPQEMQQPKQKLSTNILFESTYTDYDSVYQYIPSTS